MLRKLAQAALIALVASALLTASYLIPFNPLLLLLIPLADIFPQLGQTGPAVEIGFAWLVVKQNWVWVVIYIYHFTIVFALAAPTLLLWGRGRSVDD